MMTYMNTVLTDVHYLYISAWTVGATCDGRKCEKLALTLIRYQMM